MNRFIVIFCLFLFSCGFAQEEEKVPLDIIEKDLMAEILWDINLLETKLKKRNDIGEATKHLQREEDLKFILQKHNVTDTIFDKSYGFYATHPLLLKEILGENIKKTETLIEREENERDTT